MKTFKNKEFTERDYECTQVVFCKANEAPGDNYVEVDGEELARSSCEKLWSEGWDDKEVIYYGYL